MQLKRFPFPPFRARVLTVVLATAFAAPMWAQVCVPPPPGMVGWWPGDGNANDIIGGNNGTLQGGATFAPGKVGQAFSFNGTDASVKVTDPTGKLKLGPGEITLDAWISAPPFNGTNDVRTIVGKNNTSYPFQGYFLRVRGDNKVEFAATDCETGACGFSGEPGSGFPKEPVRSTSVVADNTWHHVAGVRRADGTREIWVDGRLENTRSESMWNTDSDNALYIGELDGVNKYFFTGLADEVEVFNRALTPAEIAAIFAAGSAGKCKPGSEAPVTATGATFGATEGVTFTSTVATFTDPDPASTSAEYSATIDWGDATATTPGTTSGPTGGPFTVSGTHTYAEHGTYAVTVMITDIDTPSNTATAHSTARVSDARLSSTCATRPVSTQTYTGPTAVFTDQSSTGTLSDFSATISWGDSSSSPGTITGGPGKAPYTVSGTHTYASTGTFLVTTTITDVDGSTTTTPACSVTIFAFATQKGAAFVIGDLEAGLGNHVTWWSSQWANINPMSGGAPPDAMKGFAGFEDNFLGLPPPNCGGSWSTDPGNSAPPPPSVPNLMGVIVSSRVTQSGSIISGDIKQVVIVRNDPGYAPSPGHPGTGTEIGIACMTP